METEQYVSSLIFVIITIVIIIAIIYYNYNGKNFNTNATQNNINTNIITKPDPEIPVLTQYLTTAGNVFIPIPEATINTGQVVK